MAQTKNAMFPTLWIEGTPGLFGCIFRLRHSFLGSCFTWSPFIVIVWLYLQAQTVFSGILLVSVSIMEYVLLASSGSDWQGEAWQGWSKAKPSKVVQKRLASRYVVKAKPGKDEARRSLARLYRNGWPADTWSRPSLARMKQGEA